MENFKNYISFFCFDSSYRYFHPLFFFILSMLSLDLKGQTNSSLMNIDHGQVVHVQPSSSYLTTPTSQPASVPTSQPTSVFFGRVKLSDPDALLNPQQLVKKFLEGQPYEHSVPIQELQYHVNISDMPDTQPIYGFQGNVEYNIAGSSNLKGLQINDSKGGDTDDLHGPLNQTVDRFQADHPSQLALAENLVASARVSADGRMNKLKETLKRSLNRHSLKTFVIGDSLFVFNVAVVMFGYNCYIWYSAVYRDLGAISFTNLQLQWMISFANFILFGYRQGPWVFLCDQISKVFNIISMKNVKPELKYFISSTVLIGLIVFVRAATITYESPYFFRKNDILFGGMNPIELIIWSTFLLTLGNTFINSAYWALEKRWDDMIDRIKKHQVNNKIPQQANQQVDQLSVQQAVQQVEHSQFKEKVFQYAYRVKFLLESFRYAVGDQLMSPGYFLVFLPAFSFSGIFNSLTDHTIYWSVLGAIGGTGILLHLKVQDNTLRVFAEKFLTKLNAVNEKMELWRENLGSRTLELRNSLPWISHKPKNTGPLQVIYCVDLLK